MGHTTLCNVVLIYGTGSGRVNSKRERAGMGVKVSLLKTQLSTFLYLHFYTRMQIFLKRERKQYFFKSAKASHFNLKNTVSLIYIIQMFMSTYNVY